VTHVPTGTLEFVNSGGLFSRLYPYFSGSIFSHSLIHIGGGRVFDAHIPRAGYREYKKAWADAPKITFRPMFVQSPVKLLTFCDEYEGAWYGALQILGYLPVLNGERQRNAIQNGLVCHEFIYDVLKFFYRLDVSGLPGPNEVTDAHLVPFLSAQSGFETRVSL